VIESPDATTATVEWSAEFEEILRANLPYLEPGQALEADQDLYDLGLDSMGTINIVLAIEAELAIELPDDDLVPETFATPRALWSRLELAAA